MDMGKDVPHLTHSTEALKNVSLSGLEELHFV